MASGRSATTSVTAGSEPRPDLPVEHAEVLDAFGERMLVAAVLQRVQHRHQLVELAGGHHVLQAHERVVLVAVGDGIEAQHRRLGRQLHVDEAGAEAVSSSPRARSTRMSRCASASAVGPAVGVELAEPHEVGVRVEDHDGQCGVRHDLLEHDAERVGLARAALPAPEGVAVEPSRQQLRRAARHGEVRADLEQRAGRRVQHLDGGGVDLLDRARLERVAAGGVERALGEHADEPSAEARGLRLGPFLDEGQLALAGTRDDDERPGDEGRPGGIADEEGAPVIGAGDRRVLGIHAPIIPLLRAAIGKTEPLEESVTVPDLSIRVAGPADAAALAELAADTFPLACPPSTTAEAIAAFIAANFTVERMGEYLADRGRTLLVAEEPDWPRGGLLDAHRGRAGRCGCRGLRRRAAGDRAQQVLHACARARLGGRRGSAHERRRSRRPRRPVPRRSGSA